MSINEYDDDEIAIGESFDDEKFTVLEASSNCLLEIALLMPAECWPRSWQFF